MYQKLIFAWFVCTGMINFSYAMTLVAEQSLRIQQQAEACHLVFIKLYKASLFADESNGKRCLELEYLRAFTAEQLKRATLELYKKIYGSEKASVDAKKLEAVISSYRDVAPGDRYGFCAGGGEGSTLLRNGRNELRIADTAFANRLLGLWIKSGGPVGKPNWRFKTCR